MALVATKRYQNTTVRLPRQVYELAKTVVIRSQAASFNEFVVQAIEEKVRRLTEAEIDAAFAQMGQDSDYQRASIALASEFAKSDWEALGPEYALKPAKHDKPKAGTSKTRSR
jgi:hypothetical protein